MIQVFLSYRRGDAGWARSILVELQKNKDIKIFMDVDDLPIGEDFPVQLKNEIENSDVCFF